MPPDIDVVHVGAVLLQMSGMSELLLAHDVAGTTRYIDVVQVGAIQ